ncbi:MAG: hypothetical protein ACPG43_01780, partial [Alcanivoracaceae bacterium]
WVVFVQPGGKPLDESTSGSRCCPVPISSRVRHGFSTDLMIASHWLNKLIFNRFFRLSTENGLPYNKYSKKT